MMMKNSNILNISVDSGALCSSFGNKYGTHSFSDGLINALNDFDKINKYSFYSFCDIDLKNLKKCNSFGFAKWEISYRELLSSNQIFLALNQAIPWYVKGKIITFSHGLSFLNFPKFYEKDLYNKLYSQMIKYIKFSKKIIVSSISVSNEMKSRFPKRENDIETIPFGLQKDYSIFEKIEKDEFFLFVGSSMNIKRLDMMIDIFLKFISFKQYSNYKLYIVGRQNKCINHKSIVYLGDLSVQELLMFYRTATCYVVTSAYESFHLPIAEALSQECPVVSINSACIPEFEKFVNIANTQDEFIDLLKIVADGKSKQVKRDEILDFCSWEKYVKKLMNSYIENS